MNEKNIKEIVEKVHGKHSKRQQKKLIPLLEASSDERAADIMMLEFESRNKIRGFHLATSIVATLMGFIFFLMNIIVYSWVNPYLDSCMHYAAKTGDDLQLFYSTNVNNVEDIVSSYKSDEDNGEITTLSDDTENIKGCVFLLNEEYVNYQAAETEYESACKLYDQKFQEYKDDCNYVADKLTNYDKILYNLNTLDKNAENYEAEKERLEQQLQIYNQKQNDINTKITQLDLLYSEMLRCAANCQNYAERVTEFKISSEENLSQQDRVNLFGKLRDIDRGYVNAINNAANTVKIKVDEFNKNINIFFNEQTNYLISIQILEELNLKNEILSGITDQGIKTYLELFEKAYENYLKAKSDYESALDNADFDETQLNKMKDDLDESKLISGVYEDIIGFYNINVKNKNIIDLIKKYCEDEENREEIKTNIIELFYDAISEFHESEKWTVDDYILFKTNSDLYAENQDEKLSEYPKKVIQYENIVNIRKSIADFYHQITNNIYNNHYNIDIFDYKISAFNLKNSFTYYDIEHLSIGIACGLNYYFNDATRELNLYLENIKEDKDYILAREKGKDKVIKDANIHMLTDSIANFLNAFVENNVTERSMETYNSFEISSQESDINKLMLQFNSYDSISKLDAVFKQLKSTSQNLFSKYREYKSVKSILGITAMVYDIIIAAIAILYFSGLFIIERNRIEEKNFNKLIEKIK